MKLLKGKLMERENMYMDWNTQYYKELYSSQNSLWIEFIPN